MKTNAIVRIVLLSIVIFVLLGILLAGLGIGLYSAVTDSDSSEYTTSIEPLVCLDPSTIRRIQVEWVAGSIQVLAADTEAITFSESGHTNENQKMVWKQSGDTLTIQYKRPQIQFGFFSEPSKDLLITVPQDWNCAEFDIETVSGDVTIDGVLGQALDVEGVSAACNFRECFFDKVNISTVSGDVNYAGSLDRFSCEAVSARCELSLHANARQIELDGVSGDLIVQLPAGCGFTADLDTASGDVNISQETRREGGRYVHGDGSCQIEVSTASGDLEIRQNP